MPRARLVPDVRGEGQQDAARACGVSEWVSMRRVQMSGVLSSVFSVVFGLVWSLVYLNWEPQPFTVTAFVKLLVLLGSAMVYGHFAGWR